MLCRSDAVSKEIYDFYISAQITALCLKLCHLKDKDTTSFTALMQKGGKEIKVQKE
jgi:thymidine phosphorylase